jgi:hypothetical protein
MTNQFGGGFIVQDVAMKNFFNLINKSAQAGREGG